MSVKKIIKKIIFGNRSDSDTYINYLRSRGMIIGERVNIYEPRSVHIDETRPFLISIGDDVKITRGVTLLTHGYDWSVLAGMYDIVLGSAGGITIGNNVFIGMNTTILKGVTVGNNVVIGANSLVNKDIPDNCVAAGNPCRVIMSIEDYYNKRMQEQEKEAFELYSRYINAQKKEPPEDIWGEFFWLFAKREDPLPEYYKREMEWHDRYKETLAHFKSQQPKYNGYEEFLKAAKCWHSSNSKQAKIEEK